MGHSKTALKSRIGMFPRHVKRPLYIWLPRQYTRLTVCQWCSSHSRATRELKITKGEKKKCRKYVLFFLHRGFPRTRRHYEGGEYTYIYAGIYMYINRPRANCVYTTTEKLTNRCQLVELYTRHANR